MFLIALQIYQWLVPLIAIFFVYRVINQFRNNKRLLIGTLLWVGFWIMVSVLAIKPDFISENLASSLGFKSNINAVIFVALGFLFIMTYYQSSIIDLLEKQMTELVRKLALEKQREIDDLKDQLNAQSKLTKTEYEGTKSSVKSFSDK